MTAFKNFPRTVTFSEINGRFFVIETDGTKIPLNRHGYAEMWNPIRILRRFYCFEVSLDGLTVTLTGVRDENAETASRDEAFSGRMVDHEIAMEAAAREVAAREVAAREVAARAARASDEAARLDSERNARLDAIEADASNDPARALSNVRAFMEQHSANASDATFNRAAAIRDRLNAIEALSDKSAAILSSLRANRDGSTETDNTGAVWAATYLDNARPGSMSAHAFAGHLSALEKAGLYRRLGDDCFGMVRLDAPAMVPQPVQQAQAQDMRAAAPVAAVEPFRGFAGPVHDFAASLAERARSRKFCGPYDWTPTPAGSGRGFYMERGSGLECAEHGSGFRLRIAESDKSYSFDDFGGTYTGIVLRLPRARGFLAGATMGVGMSSHFEPGIWQDEDDAMRRADDIAERSADEQRDYEAASNAALTVMELGEEYTGARKRFLAQARAIRAAMRDTVSDALLDALETLTRGMVEVRSRTMAERNKLESEFMNSDGYRDAIA